jgi:hypothetical protein
VTSLGVITVWYHGEENIERFSANRLIMNSPAFQDIHLSMQTHCAPSPCETLGYSITILRTEAIDYLLTKSLTKTRNAYYLVGRHGGRTCLLWISKTITSRWKQYSYGTSSCGMAGTLEQPLSRPGQSTRRRVVSLEGSNSISEK